jgi:hypothetical protein
MAMIVDAFNVVYAENTNDGSLEGVIQIYGDSAAIAAQPFGLTIVDNYLSFNIGPTTAAALSSPPNLSGINGISHGLTFERNTLGNAAGQKSIRTYGSAWAGPFNVNGNLLANITSIADSSLIGPPDASNIGTTVNHPGDLPVAALDIQVIDYSHPGRVMQDLSNGPVWEYHGISEGGLYGPSHIYDQLYSPGLGAAAASAVLRTGKRPVWVNAAAGTSTVTVGDFPIAGFSNAGYTSVVAVTMRVVALAYTTILPARWEIRQMVAWNTATATFVGAPELMYKNDTSGLFTDPQMAISGASLRAVITEIASNQAGWNIQFDYEFLTGY